MSEWEEKGLCEVIKYDKSGWKGSISGQTPGTPAGSKYLNRDNKLPSVDAAGDTISYREFDINKIVNNRRLC